MQYYSPLRYPGGKRKLTHFFKLLLAQNGLIDGEYVEVYAGGAAVALGLLFDQYVSKIQINDLDRGVHAFWDAALHSTDEFCKRVHDVPLTIAEWERQRAVYESEEPDPLDLALATFYLNRTNRSGIITGGVIGGKDQTGEWGIDARFNKEGLVQRIEKIGRFSSQIRLHNLDAIDFLNQVASRLPPRSLTYIDPPYFVKGKRMLYANFYEDDDHAAVAECVRALRSPWVVSYDNAKEIAALYEGEARIEYDISYSAQDRYKGDEVAFFSAGITIPDVDDPGRIRKPEFKRLEAALN